MDNVEQIVDTATVFVTTWGLKVVGAIVVLIVGRIVAGWARNAVRRVLERRSVDPTLVPFLASLVYYLLIAVVAIMVLERFGVQTASLVAVLGAAGLAVGLALQGTLSSFSAGVMLLAFRPFKVGDYVDVGGTAGSVVEIGLFTTTLKSPDNVMIVVPNSQVYGQTIKNYNGYDTRRLDMVMGISYDDDIQVALDTIHRVVTADARVLSDPEPLFAVGDLGASSVDIVVRPWCAGADYWGLKFDLTRKLKEELEAAGCSIPYPQQDVHLVQEAKSA